MKRTMVMLLAVLMSCPMGWAEEPKPVSDLPAYLDKLQVKLEHTAQRANRPGQAGASVVGLRGSKQEPVSKQLYWKGKTGVKPVSTEEVKAFRAAIEQAQAGQKAEAAAALKAFVEKYPKSGLKGDAEDTLKILASADARTAAAPVLTTPAPTPSVH